MDASLNLGQITRNEPVYDFILAGKEDFAIGSEKD